MPLNIRVPANLTPNLTQSCSHTRILLIAVPAFSIALTSLAGIRLPFLLLSITFPTLD